MNAGISSVSIPTPTEGMDSSEQADLELQTSVDKEFNAREFVRKCCYVMFISCLAMFIFAFFYIEYLRSAIFQLRSLNLSSSVAYRIRNSHSRGIKVTHLYGDFQFDMQSFAAFELKDLTISKKETNILEIPLSKVTLTPGLAKHCIGNESFIARVNLYVEWSGYFWMLSSYRETDRIEIPCSQIRKVNG